uniref:HDC17253 n=1 Tax=Drosophila melanogaster TaxID=7227 RepID=Q6IIS3_DROME|nr:TPA_inf: HDC17253 [Drosophila melanogaster]
MPPKGKKGKKGKKLPVPSLRTPAVKDPQRVDKLNKDEDCLAIHFRNINGSRVPPLGSWVVGYLGSRNGGHWSFRAIYKGQAKQLVNNDNLREERSKREGRTRAQR